MSKNTASNAFRKIDVDAFNEDNFRDEDTAGTGPQPGQGGAVASEAQIGTWIQEGKTVEALQALLSQAPIANKNQQDKVRRGLQLQHGFCVLGYAGISYNNSSVCHQWMNNIWKFARCFVATDSNVSEHERAFHQPQMGIGETVVALVSHRPYFDTIRNVLIPAILYRLYFDS